MTTPLLDRANYDHPEHFDDEIRNYKSSKRYIPTPLEALLFELAGHHCTICRAPWLEIHHIDELGEGGQTVFDNLIVLCPNCHTRVHSDGTPSKEELRHYKLKQEIAYELPILSRISLNERTFIAHVANLPLEAQIAYSKREYQEISAPTQDAAVEQLRRLVGFDQLEQAGIVQVERGLVATLDEPIVSVNLHVRLTGKGQKWVRYLSEANRIPTV